jgi:Putative zinc-finger
MCNKEQLVSYLYEDLKEIERAKVDMHLRTCEACRDELDGLRGVRVDLAAWAPPLPDLGFRIVRDAKHLDKDVAKQLDTDVAKQRARPATQPSWRSWWTPAAGLAAAATLVLAAALSIAHVEIRRGPDGVTVRTGWSTASSSQPPASLQAPAPSGARDVVLSATDTTNAAVIAGLVHRIDALETALRQAPATRNAAALSARASDEEMIKRVRDLVARSEMKQQGELVLRVAQVINAFEAQRKDDLARIQANFTQLNANVTTEAAQHRELVNYITTAGKQK